MGYLARHGLRLKTEKENGVFLLRFGKRFSLKNGKRYGFRLHCRGFLSQNRGNGRSRNGRGRYGQGDKFERTTVIVTVTLYFKKFHENKNDEMTKLFCKRYLLLFVYRRTVQIYKIYFS